MKPSVLLAIGVWAASSSTALPNDHLWATASYEEKVQRVVQKSFASCLKTKSHNFKNLHMPVSIALHIRGDGTLKRDPQVQGSRQNKAAEKKAIMTIKSCFPISELDVVSKTRDNWIFIFPIRFIQ